MDSSPSRTLSLGRDAVQTKTILHSPGCSTILCGAVRTLVALVANRFGGNTGYVSFCHPAMLGDKMTPR